MENLGKEAHVFLQTDACNVQGPVVRMVDSAIHRIVIFSTVVKMLKTIDIYKL